MFCCFEYKAVLVYGKHELLDAANPTEYAYTRTDGKNIFPIVLNFTKEMGKTSIPKGFSLGQELINNLQPLKVEGENIVLQPYQAVVIKLK